MTKKILLASFISLYASGFVLNAGAAKPVNAISIHKSHLPLADTAASAEVMKVVKAAINAIDGFNLDAVANIYTPNAVVADDEAPYSWNGQTAGVQWVEAVEKACKELHFTKFKGRIEGPTIYQQTADNVYVVVPVTFTGTARSTGGFSNRGAFAFVLRLVNDKWLIKSQVWIREKGME